jgi:hypothetical protein
VISHRLSLSLFLFSHDLLHPTRKSLGVHLNPTIPRPALSVPQPSSSTQSRNQSNIFSPPLPTHTNLSSSSAAAAAAKASSSNRPQKPKNFLDADPRVLRFNALEVESKNVHINITGSSTSKTYGFQFYLSDETMEIRLLKKTSHDESAVLVRRQRIPKSVSSGSGSGGRSNVLSQMKAEEGEMYLEACDLLCGAMVEIYGRRFLVLTCDEATRDYFREIGIEQQEVVVEPSNRAESKSPGRPNRQEKDLGTGLQIGERELMAESTRTQGERGMRENGVTLRCKCELLTGGGGEGSGEKASSKPTDSLRPKSSSSSATAAPNYRRGQGANPYTRPPSETNYPRPPTGQWFQTQPPSRLLLLTFYSEDQTLALNEENPQNSLLTGAGTGKSFLRRNKYLNELSGSPCEESDLYLGNTVKINGFLMKIVELDEAMWRYCEERGEEFAYFDIHLVADHLLQKVRHLLPLSLSLHLINLSRCSLWGWT